MSINFSIVDTISVKKGFIITLHTKDKFCLADTPVIGEKGFLTIGGKKKFPGCEIHNKDYLEFRKLTNDGYKQMYYFEQVAREVLSLFNDSNLSEVICPILDVDELVKIGFYFRGEGFGSIPRLFVVEKGSDMVTYV